jgi:hypothetical protein
MSGGCCAWCGVAGGVRRARYRDRSVALCWTCVERRLEPALAGVLEWQFMLSALDRRLASEPRKRTPRQWRELREAAVSRQRLEAA